MADGRLAGKVAVVTGAGRGLGLAIATRLAAEGADIAVAGRGDLGEVKAAVEGAGQRCCAVQADLSAPQGAADLAGAVRAELGAVDIVVNNAALEKRQAFVDLTDEDWRTMWATNMDSMFFVVRAFSDDLKRSGAGRIINMGSGSVWLDTPQFVNYASTKAALIGFTYALATELGPDGVTVNLVAPGLIPTPGSRAVETQEVFDAVVQRQSIKREGTPEEIAGLVAYLAADEAGFVTSQIIGIDGGLVRR